MWFPSAITLSSQEGGEKVDSTEKQAVCPLKLDAVWLGEGRA